MIVDYAFAFIVTVLAGLIDLLPDWTAPGWLQEGGEVEAAAETIGAAAGGLSNWLPFGDVLSVVLPAFVGLVGVMVVYHTVSWVISLVRGSGQ